jgi:tetratricopeptide (TPR) repeat protein
MLSSALDIRITLGPALIAVHGAAALEVEASYRLALDIADRLADTSRRFPVLWGLWFVAYSQGRYAAALERGERLLEEAKTGNDTGRLLEAHHALWATATAMGRPVAGAVHGERGVALYDRARHASQALLYGGHDAGACARYQLAANQWVLGYPDRALASIQDAQRLAAELDHPLTTTNTLSFAGWVHFQRGEYSAVARITQQVIDLAGSHGFTNWVDVAVVLQRATSGEAVSAQTLATLGRQLVHHRGTAWRHVFSMCVFAELCLAAGCLDEGAEALVSINETDRQAFCAAEIQRIGGEFHLARGRLDEAEERFRAAIQVARDRAEKSLELRATSTLARLLDRQGRRDEARRQLTDVYGWFTEGFDTRDLREAQRLLDTLGSRTSP